MTAFCEDGMSAKGNAMHASVVSIGGWSVAICGISGAGKSDLALRLIDRGATLVGDDYVRPEISNNRLFVHAIPEIAGKIEIRGIGIVTMSHNPSGILRLIVQLGNEGERMPSKWPTAHIANYSVPVLNLAGFHASAPLKIELALKSVVDADIWPVPSAEFPVQRFGTNS